MKEMKEVYIGYWRNEQHPEFPMPQPDTAKADQGLVITRLEKAMASGRMKAMASGRMISYRGWSVCRLCGKRNGSRELEIIVGNTKYRIPEGYVHYLEQHSVGYDPKLLKALGKRKAQTEEEEEEE